jgi:hypothetical protein
MEGPAALPRRAGKNSMRCTKSTRKQNRTQSRFQRQLSRILDESEVEIILDVVAKEKKGESFRAGKLGITQSLVARGWLRRDADGLLHASDQTHALLLESRRRP